MNDELYMIELENDNKYAVVDSVRYNNHDYLLLGKLNESLDDIDANMLIYEKVDDRILVVEDNDLLNSLIKVFQDRMKNN